jgi:hypothetical protein
VTRRRLAGIAAALAIAIGGMAIVAEPASAKVALKTRIELGSVLLNSAGQYEVSGKLLSKSPACRFRRVVSLHVVQADNTDTISDKQKTKSGVGLFTVRAALAPGEGLFVTVAARDVTIKSGTRLHCATGRTTPIYPTPPG